LSKADIVLALIIGLGAYLGYKRGFLMELFYLLAIVVGIFVGFKLMGSGMEVLQREFNADKKFLPYLSFIIIFVLVLGLTLFIGNRIKNSMDNTFLGKVDSIAGAVLGIFKYAFCISVILWLATSLKVTLPSNWISGSYLYPWVAKLAQNVSGLLGQVIPFFKEIFKQF
jgi:membrane protein required for colicin V production